MQNSGEIKEINLVDAKVDAVRTMADLDLPVRVFRGSGLPPIKVDDDLDGAVGEIYDRSGFVRVTIELGRQSGLVAVIIGETVMHDDASLVDSLRDSFCAYGGLPATLTWTSSLNGRLLDRTMIFKARPRQRLMPVSSVMPGIQVMSDGAIELPPTRRTLEGGQKLASDLVHIPSVIPILPARWAKAVAAPRMKQGAKWFAIEDVEPLKRAVIAQQAMRHAAALLQEILPGGHAQAAEYVVCNPRRNDQRAGSFRINMATGAWADFALQNTKGTDLISVTAYIRGCDYAVAAAWISTRFP
jgi:hypothetical protein